MSWLMPRLVKMLFVSFVRVDWESSHALSIREYGLETHSRTSLVSSSYGPAGGAAGLLVQYLVEGHDPSVSESESQVERVLNTISMLAPRFVAQQHRRLHYVPGDNRKEGRSAPRLLFDQSLRGLFGEGSVLHLSSGSKSGSASRSATVSARRGQDTGKASGQGGAVQPGPSASHQPVRNQQSNEPGSTDSGTDCNGSILGLPQTRSADPKAARKAGTSADAERPRNARHIPPYHGPSLQDHPICGTPASHRSAGAIQSALVPLESIQPVDLALATPVLPDHIVRAVHDQSYTAVAFAVPGFDQPHCPSVASAYRSLVSTGLCSPGIYSRDSDLAGLSSLTA
jgi:hypothetical protein